MRRSKTRTEVMEEMAQGKMDYPSDYKKGASFCMMPPAEHSPITLAPPTRLSAPKISEDGRTQSEPGLLLWTQNTNDPTNSEPALLCEAPLMNIQIISKAPEEHSPINSEPPTQLSVPKISEDERTQLEPGLLLWTQNANDPTNSEPPLLCETPMNIQIISTAPEEHSPINLEPPIQLSALKNSEDERTQLEPGLLLWTQNANDPTNSEPGLLCEIPMNIQIISTDDTGTSNAEFFNNTNYTTVNAVIEVTSYGQISPAISKNNMRNISNDTEHSNEALNNRNCLNILTNQAEDDSINSIPLSPDALNEEFRISTLPGLKRKPNIIISSSSESDNELPLTKKRPRKPDQWKANNKKKLRNTGKRYSLTVTGKSIPERKMRAGCNETCRLKCSQNISMENRKKIFDQFWNIGNLERQRDFVNKCMSIIKPKYSLHKETSKRSLNNGYHFVVNSERIRVCKKMFTHTLDIGHSFLSTTIKKVSPEGILDGDKRGKHHKKGRIVPDLVKESVRNHINSYPRKESHYCRENTRKTYIDGDLNLKILYRHYITYCKSKNLTSVTESMYRNIFRTEFNISFYEPKKDACSLCSTYKNATGLEKQSLEENFNTHQKQKELSRSEKENDIALAKEDNENRVVACFDLQAVLQTPCGNESLFYYKSRLNVYNCTVYDIVNKKGYCYLWDESLGDKGCDEVGTCIFKYLKEHCVGKHVIFYTDNCSAQNKNKYLMSLYLYCIKHLGIKSITHKYLVVGHTQNEGDSVHAMIEKEKKRILKNGSIYIPAQWNSIVLGAKKNGNLYQVINLNFDDILDLKRLSKLVGKNFTHNLDGEKIVWNDVRKFSVEPENPTFLQYSYTYEDRNMQKINVRQKMRSKPVLELNKKFTVRPTISAAKQKDLLALCKSNAIPKVYWSYYEGLQTSD